MEWSAVEGHQARLRHVLIPGYPLSPAASCGKSASPPVVEVNVCAINLFQPCRKKRLICFPGLEPARALEVAFFQPCRKKRLICFNEDLARLKALIVFQPCRKKRLICFWRVRERRQDLELYFQPCRKKRLICFTTWPRRFQEPRPHPFNPAARSGQSASIRHRWNIHVNSSFQPCRKKRPICFSGTPKPEEVEYFDFQPCRKKRPICFWPRTWSWSRGRFSFNPAARSGQSAS